MTYAVRVAPCVVQELVAYLPESVRSACVRFIYGQLAGDPHGVGTALQPPFMGHWCAERGEYRIRYRVDATESTIDILDVTHRRDPSLRALLR